ncbi:MAG: glutathione synthase [Alphaproteobacteria bacterium]
MSLKIGVQMDALNTIVAHHDTTFALMLGAQARGHDVWHFMPQDVSYNQGTITAWATQLYKMDDEGNIEANEPILMDLREFDIILLRQDPPFDMGYITNTHLLEMITDSTLVINDPAEVRNAPEKLWVLDFEEFMPPTLVSRNIMDIKSFHKEHKDIILKPLHAMGGAGVLRLKADDGNLESLLELYTQRNSEPLMIQAFVPQISAGDKRIILIDGEPCGVLNRVPALGAVRANMASGGKAEAGKMTDRYYEICTALKAELRERGLLLVGIDVIGDYLTEINVTSPTGLQEIERFDKVDLRSQFWQAAEDMLNNFYTEGDDE